MSGTLKRIRILQLGDVHLPDHQSMTIADLQDDNFPPRLTDAISPSRLQAVLRKASERIRDAECIALCGDLTSRGDRKGYEACIDYLIEALDLHEMQHRRIHIVPGNHDVDRSAVPATGSIDKKFTHLAQSWKERGLDVMSPDGIRTTKLHGSKGDNTLEIISINSCIGCGEFRQYPETVRQALCRMAEEETRLPGGEHFDIFGETLDSPAFDDRDLHTLEGHLADLLDTDVTLLLSHHNLLQQAMPRISLYANILNGGLARISLANAKPTILYLHGHTHNDAIEHISNHKNQNSPLISIAAPQLSDGFNELQIELSRNRMALGCVVRQYRMQEHALVTCESSIRLPLQNTGFLIANRVLADDSRLIYRHSPPKYTRLPQVLDLARSTLKKNIRISTLAKIFCELEWLGLAQVLNRDSHHSHWQVRRIEL